MAITAAAVGVILNRAVWFAPHRLFLGVDQQPIGPLRLRVPDTGSRDAVALMPAMASMIAQLCRHVGLLWTLSAYALAGMIWRFLF